MKTAAKILLISLFGIGGLYAQTKQEEESKVKADFSLELGYNYLSRGFIMNDGITGYLKGNLAYINDKNSLTLTALQSDNLSRKETEPSNIEHTFILEDNYKINKNTNIGLGFAHSWMYGFGIPYINEAYASVSHGPLSLTVVKGFANVGGVYAKASFEHEVPLFTENNPIAKISVGAMNNYFVTHTGLQDLTIKFSQNIHKFENISVTLKGAYQYSFYKKENSEVSFGLEAGFFK